MNRVHTLWYNLLPCLWLIQVATENPHTIDSLRQHLSQAIPDTAKVAVLGEMYSNRMNEVERDAVKSAAITAR